MTKNSHFFSIHQEVLTSTMFRTRKSRVGILIKVGAKSSSCTGKKIVGCNSFKKTKNLPQRN